jgi:hypothetical protein
VGKVVYERGEPYQLDLLRGSYCRIREGIRVERLNHAGGDVHGTEGVLEPSVLSSGVDKEGRSELADSPEPLEFWGVDNPNLEFGQIEIAMNGIPNYLVPRKESLNPSLLLLIEAIDAPQRHLRTDHRFEDATCDT